MGNLRNEPSCHNVTLLPTAAEQQPSTSSGLCDLSVRQRWISQRDVISTQGELLALNSSLLGTSHTCLLYLYQDQFSSTTMPSYCHKHTTELITNYYWARKVSPYISVLLLSRAQFHVSATVSTESALTEAGNSVLLASVFHGLAANFGFCSHVLHITRYSTLTRLAQKYGACT